MSDGQPRQVQCKLGDVDADGNWQLGSTPPPRAPAPPSGSDEDSDEEDDESDSGSSPSLDD